jgi:CDP-6-deoxy-D-xylo-4-hexulose-3-dehydrase
MTMGEGGFVATNSSKLRMALASLRDWGRACYCNSAKPGSIMGGTACGNRLSNWFKGQDDIIYDHRFVFDEIGYNLKPIELQGAMGMVQLEKLETIHALRRRNYSLLFDIYSKYEEYFHLPRAQEYSDPSWFAFPLTIRAGSPFKRSDIVDYLEDKLIQTRPYFAGNIMLQPAYSHLMNPADARDNYPVATMTMTNTYFHGTSPVITPEQIKYIGEVVDSFMSLFGG